eukprot:scpid72405/ scgid29238/ 
MALSAATSLCFCLITGCAIYIGDASNVVLGQGHVEIAKRQGRGVLYDDADPNQDFITQDVLDQLDDIPDAPPVAGHDEFADVTNCLEHLFLLAGIDADTVPRYVSAFVKNGMDAESLFKLSFMDLFKLLQSSSFNVTHSGDIYRIHQCTSDHHGRCVKRPFCKNSGKCVFSHEHGHHLCSCSKGHFGDRCENIDTDPIARLQGRLDKFLATPAPVGVTYMHWGGTCNETTGAAPVYTGFIAGQFYSTIGSGANDICLPNDPEYNLFQAGFQNTGIIYNAELEGDGFIKFRPFADVEALTPVCSVCYARDRNTQYVVVGKPTCPSGWTLEYAGYLQGSHHRGQGRSENICIDENPQGVPGSELKDTDGAPLVPIEVACGELPCPPYVREKEVTCAVCTR